MTEYAAPKDPIVNPMVEFQLGKTPSGEPCVIYTYLGATGKKSTVIHEDFEYFRAIVELMKHGQDVWAVAVAQGIDKALEMYGTGDPAAPDDASALFEEGGPQ